MHTLLPHQHTDEHYMRMALQEAEKAMKIQEVPIGAVIVYEHHVIGRGYNQTECLQDPTAHAEILAIKQASMYLSSRRLLGCTLYVTLEPCSMCAGAIVLARISRVVFAASDPKSGACGTLYNITQDKRLNHRCYITRGILEHDSAAMLRSFFVQLRRTSQASTAPK